MVGATWGFTIFPVHAIALRCLLPKSPLSSDHGQLHASDDGPVLGPTKRPNIGRFLSGSEKGVFWKRGLFRKVHFLEILENLEILEILEIPQTVESKGESDHFLENPENLENLEILEIPPVKRPLS